VKGIFCEYKYCRMVMDCLLLEYHPSTKVYE
jgi:hypothetical protein